MNCSAPRLRPKLSAMKPKNTSLRLVLLSLTLAAFGSPLHAAVFTSDTLIGPDNIFFDGDDLTLSNCTVTVDGPHNFANVHVLAGGVLTHSFSTNGFLPNRHILGELQTLNGTNANILKYPNVLTNTLVVNDTSLTITYTQGVDYVSAAISNGFYSLQRLDGSSIPDGATVSVNYDAQVPSGLTLTVSTNVEVEVGGAIDAGSRGYGPAAGPGAGASSYTNFPYPFVAGSGGGYGGFGGNSSTLAAGGVCYGSLTSPANLGSGGGAGQGAGGAGGGLIQITAGGLLRVDGRISAGGANGLNPHSGGGAGGTISLAAQVWSGSGSITANGGAGEPFDGGGGGGGRIAIYCASDLFTGTLAALGGAGSTYGGAGTVFTQTGTQPGLTLLDNGGWRGANTLFTSTAGADLTVSGGATLVQTSQSLVRTFMVRSNGWVSFVPGSPTLLMNVLGDASIQAGGGILGDGRGFGPGQGPGAGVYPASGASGAGHGGFGGAGPTAPGGIAYDVQTSPSLPGSGGGGSPGGAGGAAVRLTVDGNLNLDGIITLNGNPGVASGSGGGSGGTFWVQASYISGAGTISANGGAGDLPSGSGGAGGCIAINATPTNFSASLSAHGGTGFNIGGAGTIFTLSNGNAFGLMLVDNGGPRGTNTPLAGIGTFDLTARNGAVILWPSAGLVRNFSLGSNSWLTVSSRTIPVNANISGDATIQAGALVMLDGFGFAGGSGTGPGGTLFTSPYGNTGGGGGNGGYGGSSAFGAGGGNVSGSVSQPDTTYGSGGGNGNGTSPNNLGGAGGGVFSLTAVGKLTLDGQITANGTAGIGQWSGGGSGGSITLSVGIFSGHGSISANGGAGDPPYGGGGGGGRIMIYATNQFAGTISATGGAGATPGGAGTIYLQSRGIFYQELVVDNGGLQGTNTPLSFSSYQYDLFVTGGARLIQATPSTTTLGNLLVGSNSWLSWASPFATRTLTVTTNATIQAGGRIILDGQGASTLGNGLNGGGGGYGGNGGNSSSNSINPLPFGGNAYGQINENVASGSSGSGGALGGGGLTLNVTRTLSLDGTISANGLSAPPSGMAGGGSGGGVSIVAGLFVGSGNVFANGGDGAPQGGGGGGGRIMVSVGTNQFSGAYSARGGAGFVYGGAGTIYLASPKIDPRTTQVIIDNGGNRGTNTPFSFSGTVDLTVSGGAQAVFSSGAIIQPPLQNRLRNVLVASNSVLGATAANLPQSVNLNLFVSNVVIQAGGAFTMDGLGNSPGGPGAGGTIGLSGGGGGYGGYGGNSSSNAPGGNAYGSVNAPVDLGSSGGGNSSNSRSGAGGGALTLTATGDIQVDGRISADGSPALLLGAGGGSGGSVRFFARQVLGSGVISASGGAGLAGGGGGGGGRIAMTYSNNLFTGALLARGGAGATFGGAGTIYLTRSNSQIAQIIVDNGGVTGSNTLISSAQNYDLTIGSGASVLGAFQVLNSLLIKSNGQLLASSPSPLSLRVSSNAVIQAGGAIMLNGKGSPGGQGLGAGGSSQIPLGASMGSGAGHGGYGGATIQASGGNSYDVLTSPTSVGSGGGPGNGNSTNNLGGAGGGALNLTVVGSLALDGRIAADGLAGVGQWSGGGSGGSVYLSVGTMSGGGTISANGGAGDPPYGGGGGGGRIALIVTSNQFQGNLVAHGGAGTNVGGAGTIYLRSGGPNGLFPQVLVDNGGTLGTNTPLSLLGGGLDLTVSGGAVANPTGGSTIRNLLVTSNAWLGASSNLFTSLQLTVTGDANLQAGGGILLDGKGFPAAYGPGAGGPPANGGGYGGVGGAGAGSTQPAGGSAYGSMLQPTNAGSGGAVGSGGYLGSGGGALRLIVSNSLVLDGLISANGGNGIVAGGGGSGGSVWLSAGRLAGAGAVSANGGGGDLPSGGGGGGGRIALYFSTNQFTGTTFAHGGTGVNAGGAGTIYTRTNSSPVGQMLVDNGGLPGANTPLSAPEAFNLSILGHSLVNPTTPNLLLSGLLIDSGANLTHLPSQSNLDLIIFGSAVIGTNGSISVNGEGFNGANGGPGAGLMLGGTSDSGSGAGYGGAGGASTSGALGGTTYGSATQPLDRGSRGGLFQASSYTNFCQGGGAVRLRVSQTLTVNGLVTANGNDALFNNAGGGSGGSIWLTARTFDGNGFITANGGAGEPIQGGGGGGGRIAINTRTNHFTGLAIAAGNYGANWGADGTVVITNIPAPQVIAQNPSNVVFYAVSNVDLTFSSLMNPATVAPTDFLLNTPDGLMNQADQTVTALDMTSFRLSFPPLDTIGYYELSTGPAIEDIYGDPMAAANVGSFVIFPPTISGQVTDTNGLPVQFVTMRAGPDFLPVVTDVQGKYSIEVIPGWTGTLTPSKGVAMFVPPYRNYFNVGTDLTNQNFVMVSPYSLLLTSQPQGSNIKLACYGINGVTYQMQSSTNLVDWVPFGSPVIGSNCQLSVLAPVSASPQQFFRFVTTY
jgi:hypothetical protein